jgi:Na+-transporting methylmalonyl-CoA/oxaloacetate decarboxylase gamma subunit
MALPPPTSAPAARDKWVSTVAKFVPHSSSNWPRNRQQNRRLGTAKRAVHDRKKLVFQVIALLVHRKTKSNKRDRE